MERREEVFFSTADPIGQGTKIGRSSHVLPSRQADLAPQARLGIALILQGHRAQAERARTMNSPWANRSASSRCSLESASTL